MTTMRSADNGDYLSRCRQAPCSPVPTSTTPSLLDSSSFATGFAIERRSYQRLALKFHSILRLLLEFSHSQGELSWPSPRRLYCRDCQESLERERVTEDGNAPQLVGVDGGWLPSPLPSPDRVSSLGRR
jgi:hypothetical protein